jgi:hypothetical protein
LHSSDVAGPDFSEVILRGGAGDTLRASITQLPASTNFDCDMRLGGWQVMPTSDPDVYVSAGAPQLTSTQIFVRLRGNRELTVTSIDSLDLARPKPPHRASFDEVQRIGTALKTRLAT